MKTKSHLNDAKFNKLLDKANIQKPPLNCPKGHQITHLCINSQCKNPSFFCKICYPNIHHKCKKQDFDSLYYNLQQNIGNQKGIFEKIYEIGTNLIETIHRSRSTFATKELFLRYDKNIQLMIDNIFVKKQISNYEGDAMKSFRLALINKNTSNEEKNSQFMKVIESTYSKLKTIIEQQFQKLFRMDSFFKSDNQQVQVQEEFYQINEQKKSQIVKNFSLVQSQLIINQLIQTSENSLSIVKPQQKKEIKKNKKTKKGKKKDLQQQKIQIDKVSANADNQQKIVTSINDSNLKLFQMIKDKHNLKLKYLYPDHDWYSFIRPFPLEVNKQTRLKVKQTNTTYNGIIYGISTDKIVGIKSPHYHLECKSYWGSDGQICQNGEGRQVGAVLYDGNIVTMVADLINWKISWETNGNKFAEADITADMRNNRLYFIIAMFDENDEVEIVEY